MGPWGPQSSCPCGDNRDTQGLSLQGRGGSQSLVPKGTPSVLIPMGSCGPPEAPFHGDPLNLILAGPQGPLSHPCCSSRAWVFLSPWTAGHQPYQAPGIPCPRMNRLGVPVGFPPCGGTPLCPPRGPGAPSLPSLPAPAGRHRRARAGHGDTRGRCHFRAGCANTASADLRPLTHTWVPH